MVEKQPVKAGQCCHFGGIGMAQTQPCSYKKAPFQGVSANGVVHDEDFYLPYKAFGNAVLKAGTSAISTNRPRSMT